MEINAWWPFFVLEAVNHVKLQFILPDPIGLVLGALDGE